MVLSVTACLGCTICEAVFNVVYIFLKKYREKKKKKVGVLYM